MAQNESQSERKLETFDPIRKNFRLLGEYDLKIWNTSTKFDGK